jgi:hypothetical protein
MTFSSSTKLGFYFPIFTEKALSTPVILQNLFFYLCKLKKTKQPGLISTSPINSENSNISISYITHLRSIQSLKTGFFVIVLYNWCTVKHK